MRNDIYLDIYIGGKWKRILPEEARTALKNAPGQDMTMDRSRSIQADDLVSLVRGEVGLTTVVVPEDAKTTNAGQ